MKKRIIILVLSVILIISICCIVYFALLSKQNNEKNTSINISIDELEKKIEKTNEFDFSKMEIIDKEKAVPTFLIDENKIIDITARIPIVQTKSSMYVVIKTNDQDTQDVKQALESYAVEYENMWSTYLP